MHTHSLEQWQHHHHYLGDKHDANERRTWLVVALTAATMVAEIVGGTIYGSMALVADGWHMATHAGALGISAIAYRFARRNAHDPRLAFGIRQARRAGRFRECGHPRDRGAADRLRSR